METNDFRLCVNYKLVALFSAVKLHTFLKEEEKKIEKIPQSIMYYANMKEFVFPYFEFLLGLKKSLST